MTGNLTATRQDHGLLCPLCRIDLLMTDRQGIEIDYCPKCRGVWLDRGELDKIVERSSGLASETVGTQPAPALHQSSYRGGSPLGSMGHHGSTHGYRKKSWLHELFD